MLILKTNQIALLRLLLKSPKAIAMHTLGKELHLSSFSVRNELTGLQAFCASFGLNFFKYPGVGIQVTGSEDKKKQCLSALNQIDLGQGYTKRQRLIYAISYLAKEQDYVKQEALALSLHVSNTTIANTLKSLKKEGVELYIESKKGVGLKLHGNLLVLVSWLSSQIMLEIEGPLYCDPVTPPVDRARGFSKELFALLNLDRKAWDFALRSIEKSKFPMEKLSIMQRWHSILFTHLLFLCKKKGAYATLGNNPLANYYEVFSDKNSPTLTHAYEEKAYKFFLWAQNLGNPTLLTQKKLQKSVAEKMAILTQWEKLSLVQGLSPLQQKEVSNFFGLSIKEILGTWNLASMQFTLNPQHVLMLLFLYVAENYRSKPMFHITVELPRRAPGRELVLHRYFQSYRGLITLSFPAPHEQETEACNADIIFTMQKSSTEPPPIPTFKLYPWMFDPSQERYAQAEIFGYLKRFLQEHLKP